MVSVSSGGSHFSRALSGERVVREFFRLFLASYQQMNFSPEMILHWRVRNCVLYMNSEAVGADAVSMAFDGRIKSGLFAPYSDFRPLAYSAVRSGLLNGYVVSSPTESVWCAPSQFGLQRTTGLEVKVPFREVVARTYEYETQSTLSHLLRPLPSRHQ